MINPETEYAGQIDAASAPYPFGKARNDTVPDDGLGTPLEAKWMNDVFGFQAALMDAAGDTPNGTPEQVGASQLLTALNSVVSAAILAERQARYPVGELFITLQNSDPATILGFGTWTRVSAGRALVGYDSTDSDFNAAEKLSGSKTLSIDGWGAQQSGGAFPEPSTSGRLVTGSGSFENNENLESLAHATTNQSRVQPSYVVFVWKRTA